MKNIIIIFTFSIIFIFTFVQSQQGSNGNYNSYFQNDGFQNAALQAINKALENTNLPENIQVGVIQLLNQSLNGFANCDEVLQNTHMIWQYKKCSIMQLKNILFGLQALQKEANAQVAEMQEK